MKEYSAIKLIKNKNARLNSKGMSLIQVLMAIGIMGIMALAMMALQSNQGKANNHLEFQLKRTQLQNALVGQFLQDPNHCSCLFAGANPFPINPPLPGATLTGVSPTQIGRYNFVTTGVCATATIPQPLANSVGVDGIKTTSIQLTNIVNVGGVYSGELYINLQSTKPALGIPDLPFRIPVYVDATISAGNANFVSCSMAKPIQSQTSLDCYETGWGSLSVCLNPGRPTATPGCNPGYTNTGYADYSQSDAGCGSTDFTRTMVKSRCCRVLDAGGAPSASTLICNPTVLGPMTTSCDMLPAPTIPSCPAGETFTGLADYRQSDAGCGASSNTRAAAAAMCCRVSSGTYNLSCRSTGMSGAGPGNACSAFPTSIVNSCAAPEFFTGLSAFAQTDAGCGVPSKTTNHVGSRCCKID